MKILIEILLNAFVNRKKKKKISYNEYNNKFILS